MRIPLPLFLILNTSHGSAKIISSLRGFWVRCPMRFFSKFLIVKQPVTSGRSWMIASLLVILLEWCWSNPNSKTLKKGNLSLKDYFVKVKNLVDSLAAAGKKISQDDHVIHILKGLGSEYDPTVSVITEKEETPPLQKVYSLLLTQESRTDRNSSINTDGSLPSVNYTAVPSSKSKQQPSTDNN